MPHEIDLNTLSAVGYTTLSTEGGALSITTTRAIPSERFNRPLPITSYISVPGRYHLPLRIDLCATVDAPGLYVMLGEGRVDFATLWSDNRRIEDLADPKQKTVGYDNHLTLHQPHDLTIFYGLKSMLILIDGELRYRSKHERYMRHAGFAEKNAAGFALRVACDKRTELTIHALSVTELETEPPYPEASEIPAFRTDANDAVPRGEKATFERCISMFPPKIHQEIIEVDAFLRALRPMRFKRVIEAHGNKVSYVASEYGFSYAIYPSEAMMVHSLQWYILTGSKSELWHRKANGMEDTLIAIAAEDPNFARRMFERLEDCVGCTAGCRVKTTYEFGGERRTACHGKLRLKMSVDDLRDARSFIEIVNELARQTEMPPEK